MAKKQERSRKKGTKKKSGLLSNLILILAVCVFVFSGYQLYQIFSEYHEGKKEYEEIRELVIQEEPKKEPEEQKEPEVQPRFTVDFATLQQMNPDTVGWIRFEEPSEISYPVVKGRDNEEYLTRTFEANDNKLGTLFVDKDNTGTFTDRNTIIYGHNMKNGTMFGKLKQFKLPETMQKSRYIWVLTPGGNYKYEIFSGYTAKINSETYTLIKGPGQEFIEYAQHMQQLNAISEAAMPVFKETDKIITLSTCTGNEATRFVVQAVRIEP